MRKKNSLHLCLVSTAPIPNLVPVCDPNAKPEKVVLLVSEEMQRHANWLAQVLSGRDVACEIWPIDNPYDLDDIRKRIEKLISRSDMGDIALNVTCGSKIMSLAAYQLFRERDLPIFYVQSNRDKLLPLFPSGAPREIPDCLSLPEFLQAHGYHVTGLRRRTVAAHRHELGRVLVENHAKYERALGPLNYLAGTAEWREDLETDPIGPQHWGSRGFDDLIGLFAAEGLISQVNGRLRFASEADRFFVNGGWLEEYLFARLCRLQNRLPLQDAAMSITVETPSGTRNELDIAILHNNRLHLIECKTRKFSNGSGAGALYKMETLRDMGGITSQAMLASYRRVNRADRRRARDLEIELVIGEDLLEAEKRIERWLRDQQKD